MADLGANLRVVLDASNGAGRVSASSSRKATHAAPLASTAGADGSTRAPCYRVELATALSEFFEPPPRPPEPPEPPHHTMPPWEAPPEGTLPGVIALELVLARTAEVAVCLTRLSAYPSGFEVELLAMCGDPDGGIDPLLFGPLGHRRRARPEDGIPAEKLRFGVQFADGSKATNTNSAFHELIDAPTAPVMSPRGGSGGQKLWTQRLWVWPLPPVGPLAFVCEWPAAEIPVTRYEIDAQLLLDASSRAQVVFTAEHAPDEPS